MIAPLHFAAVSMIGLALQCSFATAEELISTIAPNIISINSNFNGSTIVVFGAIKTGGAPPRTYDVVVTVSGPRQTVMARRKERVAGIWINKGSRTFANIRSFLGVFANRPFEAIASADTLRQQGIGLKNAVFEQSVKESNPYLTNLVKIRIDEKLYMEQARAVTFLGSTVFRVDIPLPQSALVGDYNVDLKLFSSGVVVAQTSSTFNVLKVGVEAFVVKASLDYSFLYGLATTAMALLTGWLASIAFRRD